MLLFLLKKYVWVVNVLLIVAIAYSLAGMINGALRDRIESGAASAPGGEAYKSRYEDVKVPYRARSYYDPIVTTNLFGAAASGAAPPGAGAAPGTSAGGAAPKTSLSLELLGTFTRRGPGFSSAGDVAVIKNMDNGKIKGYSQGQRVDLVDSEVVEMGEVGNCRAIIRRSGGPESISCRKDIGSVAFLGKGSPGSGSGNGISRPTAGAAGQGVRKIRDGVYQIEKKMFNEFLDKPNNLINQARIVPRDDGIRVFGIKSRSVFFKIGLRNGDTIHKINEVALNDVQNALLLFNELKHHNEFTIDFTRRGKRRSNRYSVH